MTTITTKVIIPRKYAAFAQFVATALGINMPEVYGALISMGVQTDNPNELVAEVKKILGPAKKPTKVE